MIFALNPPEEINPTLRIIMIVVFFGGMFAVVFSRFYLYFEQVYATKYKKPFFLHQYVFKQKLNKKQHSILRRQFSFYNSLKEKQKAHFEHRVASFIKDKNFVTREELQLTVEMEVLVSATAIMLTFGFQKYLIDLISTIIIYPKDFYSTTNEEYHRGEFNPQLQTLVLSWEGFKEGYDIANDNLNLGIHEFAHAIHLNSFSNDDISSMIFNNGFEDLTSFLSKNESLRKELIASKYFRTYAFTNQFEFVAVIIETFIETPNLFKSQFPIIYNKTKQMLNFNFAGY